MITHLLDTSVYSQRLKRKPIQAVVRRWSELGDAQLAISTICEAELLFGLKKKNAPRLWTEYEQFLKNRLVVFACDHRDSYFQRRKQDVVPEKAHFRD